MWNDDCFLQVKEIYGNQIRFTSKCLCLLGWNLHERTIGDLIQEHKLSFNWSQRIRIRSLLFSKWLNYFTVMPENPAVLGGPSCRLYPYCIFHYRLRMIEKVWIVFDNCTHLQFPSGYLYIGFCGRGTAPWCRHGLWCYEKKCRLKKCFVAR